MILVTLNEMKPALPVTSDGQCPLSLGALPDLPFIAAEMEDTMMWAVSEPLKNTRVLWVSFSGLHN